MSKKQDILDLFDQGVKQAEIPKRLGVSRQYVSQVLMIEYRIARLNEGNEDKVDRVWEYHHQGLPPCTIATRLKMKKEYVKTLLGLTDKPDHIVLSAYQKTGSIKEVSSVLKMPYLSVKQALERQGVEIKRGRNRG